MTPPRLQKLLDTFAMFPDPADRTDLLLSYADQFREVPPEVARRPFDPSHQVPQCESDAYAWATKRPDGTLALHFAVENPSGISAKALAAILEKTLSGLTPAEIEGVSPEIVEQIFRQNISMGKGMGLMGMVNAVRALAARARETE
jgi:cysteine desulfuration protein SufE